MEDRKDEINSGKNISEAENLSSETESAQETESNASAPSISDDGEYHFVRPEQNLYEDAEFVPCGEATEIPKYYVPSEKKPKEEKPKDKKAAPKSKKCFVKLACACLACALIGGAVGGVVSWKVLDNNNSTPEATSKPISAGTSGASVSTKPSGTTDIYSLGCKQAVGITTEVTTTNWFGQTSSSAVSGSGFVVTTDGYIVTNYHVIEAAYQRNYKVSVMFYDGKTYDATIVGVEEENDVAVLKIDATGLTPVVVGDSESIHVGEEVYAIGNPLGELAFTMTTGHVSALDRSITTNESTSAINMFQFDAAVNSGNSGGPLYNAEGKVIGIVTAKYSSTGVEGLSFAIPINDAIDIANDLITNGYVTGKAYLGANIDSRYDSVYANYYNMPEGAYVFSVESGSCAEKCGLAAGDIITKLGGNEVKDFNDLDSAIRSFKAGESAEITVYRKGGYKTLHVVFDESKPNTESNGVNDSGLSSHNPFD